MKFKMKGGNGYETNYDEIISVHANVFRFHLSLFEHWKFAGRRNCQISKSAHYLYKSISTWFGGSARPASGAGAASASR